MFWIADRTCPCSSGSVSSFCRLSIVRFRRMITVLAFSLGRLGSLGSAEAIASDIGLGYRIFLVRRYLSMDIIIPYVAWISLLAILMDVALAQLSRRGFTWAHQASR